MIIFKIKSKGFTLTEILLVLVIAAAIVISAFIIYPKVKSSNNVNKELATITQIVTATKSIFGSSPDYTGWSLKTLLDAGALPDTMVLSKEDYGQYRDAWGGEVNTGTVTPGNGIVNISGYSLVYLIPRDSCAKFVSAVYPITNGIEINYNSIKTLSSVENGIPDISKIAEYCGQDFYNDMASISLTFY